MWLAVCRSGQLLLRWSTNKLPAGALQWRGTAPLQLAADSQGSHVKCEGEDGLWQDTAGFIWSLGWELSCPGGAADGWLGEPHPYSLAAATSQVGGGGGQEAGICGLNNSPRVCRVSPAVFSPRCLWSLCRRMRRGRRRRPSPRATRSRPFCRHPWSPLHRYGPSLLPSQPPRAPRASGNAGQQGSPGWKLQVIFSACISQADLCREYTVQSFFCLLPCPSGGRAHFALCPVGSGFPLETLGCILLVLLA